jgi:hypothetical protein
MTTRAQLMSDSEIERLQEASEDVTYLAIASVGGVPCEVK